MCTQLILFLSPPPISHSRPTPWFSLLASLSPALSLPLLHTHTYTHIHTQQRELFPKTSGRNLFNIYKVLQQL